MVCFPIVPNHGTVGVCRLEHGVDRRRDGEVCESTEELGALPEPLHRSGLGDIPDHRSQHGHAGRVAIFCMPGHASVEHESSMAGSYVGGGEIWF